MPKMMLAFALSCLLCLPALAAEGVVDVKSNHSVADTANKLVAALEGKGMTVFARVDHAAGAKKIDADLIVMPSHGRTGLKRLLIGSVAERVVRMAKCPVMVLRR